MIEGFSIDITNTTDKEQLVKFFTEGGLPEGVSVFVIGGKHYDYNSFLMMARTKGFVGTSIYTEERKVEVVNIHTMDGCTTIPFNLVLNDLSIHRAGGKEILDECRKIVAKQGGCKVGEAVITTAGKLPAKFVIHTVGPVWNTGKISERESLAKCYRNSLKLAVENGCRTIAFPNISTGVYRFPKKDAAEIAVKTIGDFLNETNSIDKVILVCFDEENFQFTQEQVDLG